MQQLWGQGHFYSNFKEKSVGPGKNLLKEQNIKLEHDVKRVVRTFKAARKWRMSANERGRPRVEPPKDSHVR